jgi:hypothetical protein
MISFAREIRPLFSASDIQCMRTKGVNLDDYNYMADAHGDGEFLDHSNARNVFAYLTGAKQPRMPIGGPFWSAPNLEKFENWIGDGFQA